MAGTSLLNMPPEVRLMIYNFTFIRKVTGKGIQPADGFTCKLLPPPLARVNRLFRQEVILEYYSKKEFWIQLPVRKNHYYKAFHVRCELAAHFIPMIKSLRAEIFDEVDAPWAIQFHPAPPACQTGLTLNDEELAPFMVCGATGKRRSRAEAVYYGSLAMLWRNMDNMLATRTVWEVNSLAEAERYDEDVVLNALNTLIDRSYLANSRLQATWTYFYSSG
ncbi:hypothetical protein F4678DRAFT_28213 [Xylaria arbuscula]|nr:hypothetical protein F4678DRAFT_28213 [Xylaria arbuscula]